MTETYAMELLVLEGAIATWRVDALRRDARPWVPASPFFWLQAVADFYYRALHYRLWETTGHFPLDEEAYYARAAASPVGNVLAEWAQRFSGQEIECSEAIYRELQLNFDNAPQLVGHRVNWLRADTAPTPPRYYYTPVPDTIALAQEAAVLIPDIQVVEQHLHTPPNTLPEYSRPYEMGESYAWGIVQCRFADASMLAHLMPGTVWTSLDFLAE